MLRDAIASISLFTRIPAWKAVKVEKSHYDNAVVFWPLAGWITAAITASLLWLLSFILPAFAAVVLALSARLLLTGALHEDGLADFCDGFGGGYDKERILRIMKDSHIGTYGTIALVIYFLLLTSLLASLSPLTAACAILAADPFCKLCAGQLPNLLPYARPEGAKNKISYRRMSLSQICIMVMLGSLPMIPLLQLKPIYAISAACPIAVLALLILYMRRKIGGYTGDCCGATFLLCELSMLIAIVALGR